MPEIPRLNPAIRALESGKPAFVTFSAAEIGAAQSIAAAQYDAVIGRRGNRLGGADLGRREGNKGRLAAFEGTDRRVEAGDFGHWFLLR